MSNGSRPTAVGQLRGATRLALEATARVTDLVEAMHHTIGGGPELLGRPFEAATKLFSAPTYGAIRGVTNVVGAGLELAFSKLERLLDQTGAERGAVLAVLNGVLGDYLAETRNPLAIEMKFCSGGASLEPTPASLSAAFPRGERLLVLIHGSCLDETSWRQEGHDHGAALAAMLGFVPLYLRYNSGLHVSQNGRALDALLEELVAAWPRPVEEIVLLAHSMGGLVARSACLAAEAQGRAWRRKLRALVTLGTPHHGAPLERGGNWLGAMLGLSRYSAPLERLGKLRSAGVTDLRYGNVLDAHWEGRDRFQPGGDPRTALSLPAGVDCYAIAATTASIPAALAARSLPGDGIVPVASALGHHDDPALRLAFDEHHEWIALGTSHLGLLPSEKVFAKLVEWLGPAMPAGATSR